MSSKEQFNQISPSEFFYRNRDLAGFSNPTRSLYTAVREFVENSLDACDHSGICLLYTSPSPRDATLSRMPSSA